MLTILDEAERYRRIEERGELLNPDTFESRDAAFQQRLHRGYEIVAQKYPLNIVDATPDETTVQLQARELIKPLLAARRRSKRL